VNEAGVKDLQGLKGVGPALAKAIYSHRETHGPFRRVDDLLKVKGIGAKKLAGMRAGVIISTPEPPGVPETKELPSD
jgi:competence protein ComEA